MKHTVHKVFFIWEYEKEKKWLNDMAAKGMNLTDVGLLRYTFEEGTLGEYQYHIELLEHFPGNPESISYIKFMEETGAEHVGSFKKWVYFRNKVSDKPFELSNDLDTRINHMKRISRMTGILLFTWLLYLTGFVTVLIKSNEFIYYSFYVAVFFLFFILLGYGLFKSLKAYKRLKRERIVRE